MNIVNTLRTYETSMIKSIRFQNFRKFEDFPIMRLGGINFFVGGNNAGKSTVVKAILTVFHNLSSNFGFLSGSNAFGSKNRRFFFDIPNTHIGTFGRALNNNAKEHRIFFQFEIGDLQFSMDIENPETDLSTELSGTFQKYSITYNHKVENSVFPISLECQESSLINNNGDFVIRLTFPMSLLLTGESEELKSIRRKINDLHHSLEDDIPADQYIIINQKIDSLLTTYRLLSGNEDADNKSIITEEVKEDNCISDEIKTIEIRNYKSCGFVGENIFCDLALNFYDTYSASYNEKKSEIQDEDELKALNKEYSYVQELLPIINKINDKVKHAFFGNGTINYIPAHTASQEPIFSSKTDEYQYDVIHNYFKSRLSKKPVIEWMSRFNIGKDFTITPIKGGAYSLQIVTNDDKNVELADLGMGAIQLMMLLLKLESLTNSKGYKIVLIEEPEQNLHPDFQVKLADVFEEYRKNKHFQFIIETHSEYIIRHIQVLVAEGYKESELYDNPFMVYFFPCGNSNPYNMGFQQNGKFINTFGDGFDNVADNEAIKLYEIEEEP